MEHFEPGINSAYVTHLFSEGQRGMKCLSCSKVLTISEWQSYKKCFCGGTNVVEAIARSSPAIRLQPRNRSLSRQDQRVNTTSTTPRNTNVDSSSSSSSRWIGVVILTLFLGLGVWQFQSNPELFLQKNIGENPDSTQSSSPQLEPKEVIAQYYQLATSNRKAALDLLSNEYKNQYKQNNQSGQTNSTKSFWNTINKIEIYGFLTLNSSGSRHYIKIWIKYFKNDGSTSCESQEIEVINNDNKWLINQVRNIQQKPRCDR